MTSASRHGSTVRGDDASSGVLAGQTAHLDHNRAEEHADTLQPHRRRRRVEPPTRTLFSPPASTSAKNDAEAISKFAESEEWALDNVLLERIMVDGVATFQLQFDWNLCMPFDEQPEDLRRRKSIFLGGSGSAEDPTIID